MLSLYHGPNKVTCLVLFVTSKLFYQANYLQLSDFRSVTIHFILCSLRKENPSIDTVKQMCPCLIFLIKILNLFLIVWLKIVWRCTRHTVSIKFGIFKVCCHLVVVAGMTNPNLQKLNVSQGYPEWTCCTFALKPLKSGDTVESQIKSQISVHSSSWGHFITVCSTAMVSWSCLGQISRWLSHISLSSYTQCILAAASCMWPST